jgi:hypothetical protein
VRGRGCRPVRRSRRARPGGARRALRVRRRPRGDHGHRASPRGGAAGRADRGVGILRRRSAADAGPGPRWPAGQRTEPESRAGTRFGHQRQRLHPRHRPAGRAADLRPRGRHLSRRRLHLAHPGRAVQSLRHRARRGAARAAGHPVRQEHDRGRDPAHLEEAAGGALRQFRDRLRRIQPHGRQGVHRRARHGFLRCEPGRAVLEARRHRRGPDHRARVQRPRHHGGARHPQLRAERHRRGEPGARLHPAAQRAQPRPARGAPDPGQPARRREGAAAGTDRPLGIRVAYVLHGQRGSGTRSRRCGPHDRLGHLGCLALQVDHRLPRPRRGQLHRHRRQPVGTRRRVRGRGPGPAVAGVPVPVRRRRPPERRVRPLLPQREHHLAPGGVRGRLPDARRPAAHVPAHRRRRPRHRQLRRLRPGHLAVQRPAVRHPRACATRTRARTTSGPHRPSPTCRRWSARSSTRTTRAGMHSRRASRWTTG